MRKKLNRFVYMAMAIAAGYLIYLWAGNLIIPCEEISAGRQDSSRIARSLQSMAPESQHPEDTVPLNNKKDTSGILTLINKRYSLASDFKPDDLVKVNVPFTTNVLEEEKTMRSASAEALEKLFSGAKEDGIELCAVSGYRSFKYQKQLYNEKLKARGKAYAEAYVAVPGQSEHQTGLAMDVGSFIPLNKSNNFDFGQTKEGKWLKKNAYKYGFILRYPKDREKITGFNYEPWHIRYVGLKAAREMEANNFVLEEYLEGFEKL